jgi:hypothetical protein
VDMACYMACVPSPAFECAHDVLGARRWLQLELGTAALQPLQPLQPLLPLLPPTLPLPLLAAPWPAVLCCSCRAVPLAAAAARRAGPNLLRGVRGVPAGRERPLGHYA